MARSPENQIRKFTENHPLATKVALAAAALKLSSELIWGMDRRSTLHPLHYHGPPTIASGVVFPGMGNSGDGSMKMAHQIAKVLPDQQWAYMQYDNSRVLKTETLAEILEGYMALTESQFLDVYASSMGSTLSLEAARMADVPIGIFFINSSPSHITDGYGSRAGRIAARLPDTGVAGKFLGTLIADTIRPGREEVVANIWHAARESVTGGSPKLFKSQVKILRSIDLERDWEKYKGIISPEHTFPIYVAPNSENDNTVRVDQAFLGYKRFFARFGVQLDRLEMPFAYHADTEAALRVGEDWLREKAASREHLVYLRESR